MLNLWRGVSVIAVGLAMLGGGAGGARAQEDNAADDAAEVAVAPGTVDDGAELLPLAGIGVAAAVAAAQGAATGTVGEVDLEYFGGVLVFNVDVGSQDVKVDAATGEVVSADSDD
jgi:uncharacterized membrane protein YkoI